MRLSDEIISPSQTIALAKANATTITAPMDSIPRHPSHTKDCQQQQSLLELKHPTSNPKQAVPLCIWWWKYLKIYSQNTTYILFQKLGYMFRIESIQLSGHYTKTNSRYTVTCHYITLHYYIFRVAAVECSRSAYSLWCKQPHDLWSFAYSGLSMTHTNIMENQVIWTQKFLLNFNEPFI